MSTQVAASASQQAFLPAPGSSSLSSTARRLFEALTPLHGLGARAALLLDRASSALRFIRLTYHHNRNERGLLRSGLRDLRRVDALVVQTSASFAADCAFVDEWKAWEGLGRKDRLRTLWFSGTLRAAESLDSACGGRTAGLHVAWSDFLLHLEVDDEALSQTDIDAVLGRVAGLEAMTGRRVLLSSSADRRGAA